MKKNLKVVSLATLSFMMMDAAHAYKFVIYTDEAVTNKSEQVAELMKNTYPFSKFDVEVEIVRVSAAELECESSMGIDRLVTCKDSDGIQSKAMRRGGDQAMIVKNMPKWGGSSAVGGGVPVITTGTSARAMLHEYMHTLGLCDEYEYKAEEAGFYCNMDQSKPNMVFITPQPSYADDSSARLKHGMNIPWYKDILSSTPITSAAGTRLGTGPVDYKKQEPKNNTREPQVLGEPTGLYQGKVCNQAKPNPRVSWHPGGSANIMENVEAGLGAPLERVVEKILVSKGVRKKMQVSEEAPEKQIKISNEEPGGKVTVSPQSEPEINDTGRSFFKSFFEWIKDLFQSLRNAMPR